MKPWGDVKLSIVHRFFIYLSAHEASCPKCLADMRKWQCDRCGYDAGPLFGMEEGIGTGTIGLRRDLM